MENIELWTAGLCICAAVIGIAEKLLPEGNVRIAVYFVMGLIVISSFLVPIGNISDIEITVPEQNVNTDWLNRTTQEMFSDRMKEIIKKYLSDKDIKAKNIDVYTDIDSEGSIYIDKVRITLSEQYTDRIDEICTDIYKDLGLDADVNIR